METFIALLLIIWVLLVAIYALIEGLAASRASGPGKKPNWWSAIMVTGFIATAIALAITGIVSLFS